MSIKWPLNKSMGGSVTIHNCRFTDEPIILCEGDDEIIVVMDSRVFARAYGFTTSHYDMQHIFEVQHTEGDFQPMLLVMFVHEVDVLVLREGHGPVSVSGF